MLSTHDTVFTIEQANAMLPWFKSVAKSIIEVWKEIIEIRSKYDVQNEIASKSKTDEAIKCVADTREVLNSQVDLINRYIKEIEDVGGIVEEFKKCVVNVKVIIEISRAEQFLPDRRVVFVCCEPLLEDEFKHFHFLDEIYADKQPIPTMIAN